MRLTEHKGFHVFIEGQILTLFRVYENYLDKSPKRPPNTEAVIVDTADLKRKNKKLKLYIFILNITNLYKSHPYRYIFV